MRRRSTPTCALGARRRVDGRVTLMLVGLLFHGAVLQELPAEVVGMPSETKLLLTRLEKTSSKERKRVSDMDGRAWSETALRVVERRVAPSGNYHIPESP